ncbi:glycosyltransferase family 2 protein [Mucilaginibacter sp. McL0603]|uniref:glycosyltransferase family 2 protein n=1 Tax=Mucilaginibacter sp. McL0603 TaxID=3415670 RepID=UPI003CF2C8D8
MNKSGITVALLISTYNWPEALELVFQSILNQTTLPDEILIADDGSTESTRKLIEKYSKIVNIPLHHAWQEDLGFRKARVLNMAVKRSSADYIIEIDGDILLHPKFVEDHIRNAEAGMFVQGARAAIGYEKTTKILNGRSNILKINAFSNDINSRFNAIRLPFLSFLVTDKKSGHSNIKACNLAYWRRDYIAVNGYDNQFQGWGWEDNEFAARLINAGIKKKRLKLAAVCYHLYHEHNANWQAKDNEKRHENTVKNKVIFCVNGFDQL